MVNVRILALGEAVVAPYKLVLQRMPEYSARIVVEVVTLRLDLKALGVLLRGRSCG